MRVRKGGTYVYTREHSLWEMTDATHDTPSGTEVRVIHPHGCPPPNTMGHAHVESLDGQFIGLVDTRALRKPVAEEEETMFTNVYDCPDCDTHWSEEWTAMCDSECPTCGCRNISPTFSEDAL